MGCGANREEASARIMCSSAGCLSSRKILTSERARGQQHDKYLGNVKFYRRIREKLG